MYLFLSTTGLDSIIALIGDDYKITAQKLWQSNNDQSEKLLSCIEWLLSQQGILKSQLRGIFVDNGPGSYTGLRVGVASANALAFALNIPIWPVDKDCIKDQNYLSSVVSKTKSLFVTPNYAKPPHITKKKSVDIKASKG